MRAYTYIPRLNQILFSIVHDSRVVEINKREKLKKKTTVVRRRGVFTQLEDEWQPVGVNILAMYRYNVWRSLWCVYGIYSGVKCSKKKKKSRFNNTSMRGEEFEFHKYKHRNRIRILRKLFFIL